MKVAEEKAASSDDAKQTNDCLASAWSVLTVLPRPKPALHIGTGTFFEALPVHRHEVGLDTSYFMQLAAIYSRLVP